MIAGDLAASYYGTYLSARIAAGGGLVAPQGFRARNHEPVGSRAIEAYVSKSRSLKGRVRDSWGRAGNRRQLRGADLRVLRLELLETRALLTSYTYPYGAMPDDTGEYMLGDIKVNVVLMESDPAMAPYDNNATSDPVHPGHGLTPEDWTAGDIATIKSNVETGLQWWKDTLAKVLPSASPDLLKFDYNWRYADNPVHTGYEPIARISNDFMGDSLNSLGGKGWIYDFLHQVGFDRTGDFSTDIRAFNDYSRQQLNADGSQDDWAFTIFVVNNDNDPDKFFAQGGSFLQAFSYAGGRFMIVPSSRPPSTYSHEAGHQFWALDEYLGGGTYTSQRGYYNTQNLNAADNPAPDFVQAPSIMSNGSSLTTSYNDNELDPYTRAAIGWQDSDNNGIFDVLDVPFSLQGSGHYNASTSTYVFNGLSHVNTLPNMNSSGTGDDISINQLNVVEASIDGGPWQIVQVYPSRIYQTSVNIGVPVDSMGIHDIDIRTSDLRSGVTSNVFHGETDAPTTLGNGLGGLVFSDLNANGAWDSGEPGLPDVGLDVTDLGNQPLSLQQNIEPNDYSAEQVLNNVQPGATLSAVGPAIGLDNVYARTSTVASSAGLVFAANNRANVKQQTWNVNQELRVTFDSPVSTVSLRAYGSTATATSFGRIDAYDQNDHLVTRTSTGALTNAAFNTMTVTRAQGDIAYIIAYGFNNSSVVLDSLVWGPAASATTNSDGIYSLGYLPDGTYQVHVSPPAGYTVTTPSDGYATITVSNGQVSGNVNFGISSSSVHRFHNLASGFNVDNDAGNIIAPVDALIVINYLNVHTDAEGEIAPGDDPTTTGFIDVNDDGMCTPIDALMVINYINAHPGGEGEAAQSGAVAGGNSSSGSGPAEGEGQVQVPASAAEYYAQQPIHLSDIAGDDEACTCGADVPASSLAAGQTYVSPAEALNTISAASARSAVSGDLDAAFGLSGWGAAGAKLSSPTVSPILSSSSLSSSISGWSSLMPLARKPTNDSLEHSTSKLEQTLDDIAADVAEFHADQAE